ncbi:MAG: hypothetical protein GY861_20270 [bacterium]|nr:hypothetical protein [bacterium]
MTEENTNPKENTSDISKDVVPLAKYASDEGFEVDKLAREASRAKALHVFGGIKYICVPDFQEYLNRKIDDLRKKGTKKKAYKPISESNSIAMLSAVIKRSSNSLPEKKQRLDSLCSKLENESDPEERRLLTSKIGRLLDSIESSEQTIADAKVRKAQLLKQSPDKEKNILERLNKYKSKST